LLCGKYALVDISKQEYDMINKLIRNTMADLFTPEWDNVICPERAELVFANRPKNMEPISFVNNISAIYQEH